MNIDESVKLIEALTKLLGVLVWPALLAFVLVRFGEPLKEFFSNLSEFSLKGAGFEASAKRQKEEAAAALVAASVWRAKEGATPEAAARNAKEASVLVAEKVDRAVIRRASTAVALWVDDRPGNNTYERQSLEAIGLKFVLATSTEEALEYVAERKFDVIISDMSRPPDSLAGYTLLERLRSSGNKSPLIIYAGSNAPEQRAQARSRGAIGSTNRASELFGYVVSALAHDS